MSLPFTGPAALMLAASLAAACATARPPARPRAAPIEPMAPLPDLVAETASLVQPSSAARVGAVQALLRKRGLEFTLQPVPGGQQPQGQNVVVDVGGPGKPDIIVGAHLDSALLPDGRQSHGAVDNGAGVVILARVAAALRGRPLRHRIRIVFFDLEERGLLGSRAFAASVDGARVRAMVNVDIAGYGDTILSGASGPGTAPLRQALAQVCSAAGTNCVAFPSLPPSDDRSFQAAGIPAISLAVLPALEAHQIYVLLNGGRESGLAPGFAPPILRTIHTAADTTDTLTPEGMTLMYQTVLALVLELDRL